MASPHADRRWRPTVAALPILLVAVLVVGACGVDDPAADAPTSDADTTGSTDASTADEEVERFPDVLEVEVTPLDGGRYEVATTLSSPYDSPERYADAWRVLDGEGNELGVRDLAHDHASEQPFTRRETIDIPDEVDEITVEGRDQVSGWGGATVTVAVPRDG